MIYDITKTINNKLKCWPGDQEYGRHETEFDFKGGTGHASWITASLHTGTHVDAHWHYSDSGLTIDEHNLEHYIGPCQVIDVTAATSSHIEVSDIKVAITEKRVLFKTNQQVDETVWTDDFKGLSVELVHYLNSFGVVLIGLDTPSVDVYQAETLSTHLAFYECGIYILEGLVLNEVTQGTYELIALPLKFEGADGSPVRAILKPT
ncbi:MULTISPECIES: cyclase family protein [unclassified Fusibacter]|uniref:cyclase family protein n=1 Tax=unclassified Fusibacter TaxID=2624464 RepID=UPI0010122AD5|nr:MULTISPECIES: cyclase family protein [unclassified Fusibacter]MCK8058563.1 cyclase family protein [Fusibacter sp. A2]NPE22668.1 arylformamidase [Fusibacter sp. A1]RXV60231.1 arylformamidase [Fusibacter sp. A1]